MNGDSSAQGMGLIVRTVARWLKGFVLLYGVYIVLYGHLTPGGGFAGGVIIACGFTLLVLACGERQGLPYFPRNVASALDSVGMLIFLAIAWVGVWSAAGVFFDNFIVTPGHAWFTLPSGGIIPLANLALGLKVASSLFVVFAVLAAFRVLGADPDRKRDDA